MSNEFKAPTVKEQFEGNNDIFTSVVTDDLKSKAMVYNAVNSTDEGLRNHVGETLFIRDFVAHTVVLKDEKTGEVTHGVRCILLDKDGISYGCVSIGIQSAMSKIFTIVGLPDSWVAPMPIKVLEKTGRKGYRFLTLELDLEKLG